MPPCQHRSDVLSRRRRRERPPEEPSRGRISAGIWSRRFLREEPSRARTVKGEERRPLPDLSVIFLRLVIVGISLKWVRWCCGGFWGGDFFSWGEGISSLGFGFGVGDSHFSANLGFSRANVMHFSAMAMAFFEFETGSEFSGPLLFLCLLSFLLSWFSFLVLCLDFLFFLGLSSVVRKMDMPLSLSWSVKP